MRGAGWVCSSTPRLLFAGGCIACLLVAGPSTAAQQEGETAASALRAAGISFESLITYLSGSRDSIHDAMAIKVIERFGLSFRPTPEDWARLQNSSAGEALLSAIKHARIPDPPPTVLEAAVSIACIPVDCDLWVNDRPVGRTAGGVFPWLTFPPGKVSIAAVSANFETAESRAEVTLGSGERKEVTFRFRPSRAYLEATGARLLREMRNALGSAPAAEEGMFSLKGTLYFWEAGAVAPWSTAVWIHAGQLVRAQAIRLNERYDLAMTPDGWKEISGAKGDTSQIEKALALLGGTLLTVRLQALMADGTTTIAVDPDRPATGFRTAGPAGAYVVTLDALSRPSKIRQETKEGLPDADYYYSEYVEDAGVLWPTFVQAVLPGEKGGIEARFPTVQRVQKLPESPRKRRR
jgi:hypothetical protein